MDTETRRQLMIQVERCVRPVRAANFRKDQMRRELMCHLTDVHAQERLRLKSDQEALERTLLRFGDVDEVRRELQSSVGGIEQFLFRPLDAAWMHVKVRRRPGEADLQFALRQGAAGGLLYFAFSCLLAFFA